MIAPMSSTPAQRFVCPRCRASNDQPSHFCPHCGADMTRASALERAVVDPTLAEMDGPERSIDRRLSDSNQAWLGKVVDGRYRVLDVIGRGGMGVVYRVEHLRMGKMAAMKVLHRDLAQDPEIIARFEREASAVSKLNHPHTVQVFDFGNAQGALYLIMELIRGQDLARLIDRDGPMPWARAAPLFVQVCGALQEAHELGIVHRDLKPENILITRTAGGRDYAKVLDFGLAKLDRARDQAAPLRETERQAIVGTPYFMSPEQIRGEDVDARTDLYSLGALMFELLTGEHLYTAATAVGVLTKHLTSDADAPSMRAPKMGIPPAVDHLVRKALARDPAKRWKSAQQLAEAIEEVYSETVGDTTGTRNSVAKALRRGHVVDEIASESDLRLRRSDIDAYEASIKRQRWLTFAVMFLVFGGGVAAAAYWVTRPAPTLTEERETNDDLDSATRISAGTPITGYLGKRRSKTEGDRDVYRIDWPSGERRVVSVTVTGVPNLDLNLAVGDRQGARGQAIDEGRIGEGEALHRRGIDGPLTITVAQTVLKGTLPVENVSDAYTLTVTEENPKAGESEPNGIEADANAIAIGDTLLGFLDGPDVDLLRFSGNDGTYSITLGTNDPSVIWQTGDGMQRTPGVAQVKLTRGEIIRITRGKGTPKRDATWSIAIAAPR
jgi:serine/threonine protein kinase